MLAKRVARSGKDWDAYFPFVLFAYHASLQRVIKRIAFLLMYGRDPQLPTTLGLVSGQWRRRQQQQQQQQQWQRQRQQQHFTDLDTYTAEVAFKVSEAWKLVRDNIKKAQHCQKKHCDCRTRLSGLRWVI